MWRSVFLHEFLGLDIDNYKAVPGDLTTSPQLMMLTPEPPTGAVRITPGQFFRFALADPLNEVIGISGRVRVHLPGHQIVDERIPIMRVGNAVELCLQYRVQEPWGEGAAPVSALLKVASTEMAITWLMLPYDRFVDVRFDWHTSGQARISLDGRLLSYHNAMSPGFNLDIAELVVGNPTGPETARIPNYQIGRVFVRALCRSDALATILRLMPKADVPEGQVSIRCLVGTTNKMLAVTDKLHAFMTNVNAHLTTPWQEASGPTEGPFSTEALAAHKLSLKVVQQLVEMLRTGDFSGSDVFLDDFTKFLKILHDALPTQFESIAAELLSDLQLGIECRQEGEVILNRNRDSLEPIVKLLTRAGERIKDIAG